MHFPSSSSSVPEIAKLDGLFSQWNRSDAPGLVVGVRYGGQIVYRRCFGMASLESATPLTPNTRMRIASVSKHMTALLALLLQEEGLLDLDLPIRTYIPELTGPSGEPSIRLLLQHRGGVRCFLDVAFLVSGMSPIPRGADLSFGARQKGANFKPGEETIYSNGGYHLVATAIQRVGGGSYELQMRRRLFEPLGMFDTESVRSDYEITPGIATLHVITEDGGWARGLYPCVENKGSGSIVSTLNDMLIWTSHLRSKDRFGSSSTWNALTLQPIFSDGTESAYALGLMRHRYRGRNILHHSGGWAGGTCQMLTLPDESLDVVIMSNGAPGANVVQLSERVVDILLDGYLDDVAPKARASEYKEIVGNWWSSETEMLYEFVETDGALQLRIAGSKSGVDLNVLPDASLVMPGAGLGTIEIKTVPKPPDRRSLSIKFCGRAADYQKLDPAHHAEFPEAAFTRYRSHDGDCDALITRNDSGITLSLCNANGTTKYTVTALSQSVGKIASISSRNFPQYASIVLSSNDDRAPGFRLNSLQTRGLRFERG